jgi:double-stranded uracil-DNA glycosylase
MSKVLLEGLPPIAGPGARLLIVGSMPGAESLRQQRYYAHPRNAFWPMLGAWMGLSAEARYEERCHALVNAGIALWDVIGACVRPGSLDAAIEPGTVRANDFATFFVAHPGIARVLCNGATAHEAFRRLVLPGLALGPPVLKLPSTSPANAGMSLAAKRERWFAALACIRST